jgi:Tol biopolymer transport system component
MAGSLVAVSACSLLVSTKGLDDGPSTDAGAVDAGTDEGANVDALGDVATEASGPACDLSKPFGAVTPFPDGIDDPGSSQVLGKLSPDRLTLYFGSNRSGSQDMYVSTRADLQATWGNPVPLASLNGPSNESDPFVAANQLTVYFSSDRGSDAGVRLLYFATRTSASNGFANPMLVPGSALTGSDVEPWLNATGDTLYFTSSRNGLDFYVATKSAGGAFDSVSAIDELNSPYDEESLVLTEDERTAYFGSNRPANLANVNIYVARRTSKSAKFGTPELVNELATDTSEYPTWISADGCAMVIERGPFPATQLYYTEKPR